MTPFSSDQWVMVILIFVLGLLIGMFLLAGGKWKRRYREEVRRRETLEREHREFVASRPTTTTTTVPHTADHHRDRI